MEGREYNRGLMAQYRNVCLLTIEKGIGRHSYSFLFTFNNVTSILKRLSIVVLFFQLWISKVLLLCVHQIKREKEENRKKNKKMIDLRS